MVVNGDDLVVVNRVMYNEQTLSPVKEEGKGKWK